MADTPDTPPTDDQAASPAPRRRATRKTSPKAEAGHKADAPKRTTRKRAAAKDTGIVAAATDAVHKVEDSTAGAVKSARGAASRTAKKAEDAVVGTAKKAGVAVGAVKPRSSKRAAPRTGAKSGRKAGSKSTVTRATDKVGGRWGAAAIAGGLAAAGAAAAALLTLRSSTPKSAGANTSPTGKGAHQPDGTDSSKSFEAGIADENTVPNT